MYVKVSLRKCIGRRMCKVSPSPLLLPFSHRLAGPPQGDQAGGGRQADRAAAHRGNHHPQHHELGLRGKCVGPGEGGQVHQTQPLGRDAGGGGGAGSCPSWPDTVRAPLSHQDCPGQPYQDPYEYRCTRAGEGRTNSHVFNGS